MFSGTANDQSGLVGEDMSSTAVLDMTTATAIAHSYSSPFFQVFFTVQF